MFLYVSSRLVIIMSIIISLRAGQPTDKCRAINKTLIMVIKDATLHPLGVSLNNLVQYIPLINESTHRTDCAQ